MNILKYLNAILAFLLELAMLLAFGYFGFYLGPNLLLKWLCALGLPLLAAILWGIFFAPKAVRRFPGALGAVLSLGLFLLAALALYQAQQPLAALLLALTALVNRVLVLSWRQW
jgi:hypothetical protein